MVPFAFGTAPLRAGIFAACLALAAVAPVRAQTARDTTIKGVLMYRIAAFVEWPADALPPSAPLTFCVTGEPAVERALVEAARGRQINGHALIVQRVAPGAPVRACQMLYLSGMSTKEADAIATPLRGQPILTISDIDGFSRRSGLANFFYEAGNVRLAINLAEGKRSRIQFDAQLLRVAVIVGDGAGR